MKRAIVFGMGAIYSNTFEILPGNERVRPDDLPREQKWGHDTTVKGQEDVQGCPLGENSIARVSRPDVAEHHVKTLPQG
jgi:hypothetical protein